jgi:hypothetical protein
MQPAYQLENLDLSKVTPQEKSLIEKTAAKPNIAWPTAVVFAVIQAFLVTSIISRNPQNATNEVINVVVIILGLIGLGLWARVWSRAAIALLFGWHLFWFGHLALAVGFTPKILFWWPCLSYAFALAVAFTRHKALLKASRDTQQPADPKSEQAASSNGDKPSN